MNPTISICEYQHLCASEGRGVQTIPKDVFESLELFLAGLSNDSNHETFEYKDVFQISSRDNKKTLSVQNYVGVITCGDTTIEVLPKVADKLGFEQSRKILLRMLSFLEEIPFKRLPDASIGASKTTILEVFIAAFLNEVDEVIKRGLRSDYIEFEGNERFIKGKIDFTEQIRLNYADNSRFAQRYSVYHLNRPENKLINSTIELLKRRSSSAENKRKMRIIAESFDEVDASTDAKADFLACTNDRNTAHYSAALHWARIFLSNLSPIPTPGALDTAAFLFPMETVFESYVASCLRVACARMGIAIETQVTQQYLVCDQGGNKKYELRPDIVATRKSDGTRVILDTKWKITDGESKDGPSQADMYQMFAYAARYAVDDVILVYPHTDQHEAGFRKSFFSEIGSRQIRIHTYYYDLPESKTTEKEAAEKLANYISSLFD